MLEDLRHSLRGLLRAPAFAVSALSTLALGIAAATIVFTVVNVVVLRPLPFREAERLMQVLETSPTSPEGGAVSWADLLVFRRESRSFESLAGHGVSARFLEGPDGAERVMVAQAERDFFRVLGAAPSIGRTFGQSDPADVAVISDAFWRARFGGAASALGSTLSFGDTSATVIGVMPAWFQFPLSAGFTGVDSELRTDLWVPLRPSPGAKPQGRLRVTARLAPGVSVVTAESELAAISSRIERPAEAGPRGVKLAPLSETVVAPQVRRSLFLLFGAVALVLTVACANVANLSLVRVMRRIRELAIRDALGAGRLRLMRLLVTEGLVLSAGAGLVAFALARGSLRPISTMLGTRLPRADELGVDWSMLLFLLAACAATGAIVGLVSGALIPRAGRMLLAESSGRATQGGAPGRLRDALVVLQVATALLLTIGAALLIRELMRLERTDPGMVTRNVITFHLGQPLASADVREFYEIEARAARLPPVRAAGLTQLIPLQNWNWTSSSTDFAVTGRPPPTTSPFPIEMRYVSPGYFQVLGVPVRRGRAFTTGDTADAPRVIAVNETLARRYFGEEDPIGRETNRGVIVGVVGDVRQVHLDRPASPELYFPMAQNWSQVAELGTSLIVNVSGPPEAVADDVRAMVAQVNPRLAVFGIRTMDRVVDASLLNFRLYLSLLFAFAVLAVALAAVGTYGVIAYLTQARAREWAIRMALGADRARVAGDVFRPAARLVALGVAGGLAMAFAASPLLRGLPVQVRPPDGAIAAAAATFVALLALLACLTPARRAWGVDPAVALREE